MKSARSPIRNFASLSTGQATSAVAALVTNIWLARTLGPEGLGLLGFGSAVVAYLILFTASGSDLWGARLIASKRYSATVVTGRIFGLRIWAFCLVAVIFLILAPLLAPDPDDRRVLLVQAGAVLAVPMALDYFFQGIERQTTTAVRQAGQALLMMILTVLLVQSASDVVFAAVAQAAAAFGPALIVLIVAMGRYPIGRPNLSPVSVVKTFRRVFPFTISAFVNTLFVTIDIVMLGLLSGKTETGFYVAGSRLMLFALIPAGIIFSIAYPRLAATGRQQRQINLERYAVILGLIAVAGSAVALATTRVLIETIYGESFLPTVPILGVQMLTVILIHGRMVPGGGLSSWGYQKDHARATTIAAVSNVALNAALIPMYGGMGAAVATLASQIILFVLFTYRLKIASGIFVAARQALCLPCGMVAFAVVYGLKSVLGGASLLIVGTVLSVIVVALCARLSGLIHWSDLQTTIRPPGVS